MAVTIQYMKHCSLVLAREGLDDKDCSTLEQVLKFASLSRNKTVWVDCEKMTSLPIATMRLLLSLSSKAEASGVLLLFYQLTPSVSNMIKKAGIDSVLLILSSFSEAYSYCRKKQQQLQKT